MKALKHGLIGWVCVLVLAACTEVLSLQRIQIEKAEQMLQQNAEEAIALLRSVKDPEVLPDSLRARFALAMGQAHYNAHWVMNEDSLLLYALDYYGRPDVSDTLRLLRTYKLAAHYFYDSERYKEATEMMAEGNRIAALRGDTAARLDLLRSVANIGEGNDDFEGLIRLQKQLIAIEPDSTRQYNNYNSLAVSYYCANQNDSALLALRKATECLYTSTDSLKALYYVMRNYADILSDSGKNREAINLQRHSLQEYKETKHPFESLSYYALSRYFLNMGQMDSARYYMQMGDSVRSPYIDQDLSLANFWLVQKTLMDYMDSRSFTIRDVAFFSNRLYNNFIRDQRVIAQKGKVQLLLQQQNMNLQLEKQKERTFFVGLVALCILLLLVVVWYLQRRKHLLVEKEEELEALRRLLHETEGDESGNNDKFVKKMLLQQLGLIRIVATNPSSDHQELLVLANKDVAVDDLLVWSDLYKTIDMVHDGFYTRICQKYGNILNEKELQLCCLLKSDFSTKEISVVIQQSIRTVYQRKTVIRQKLGMEEKEDIAEFLSKRI
ncbi:tetratricopeptide repeat protein [Bacteroides intestinalis]|jgi:tetratricopeptide (TPR) repeat protein/DNA-binding CsgD family transcriptional regulator|uniref:Tetratricopeptide repeat protein n=1 Tax=Bacteroides intestinalis TaxID=329854 RepID=A0AAQ0LTU2_9BACE|nr:tetratricopeptide repeat protein [Bacteroides intestinalis]QDO68140.1 tetratricopeptide repeat protein [Bacteroides intestinalis]RGT58400.1 tetratricopeptide repeat protein [Bacteroides intestinalis]RHI30458.1 tetratricopeptide repeat protein [Bacteroides intestinalis]UCB36372.1 tetratricopeptide repeat protein [Bacteroides intestinalis]UCB40614.1 tetratricopeptide repeat protein [Bacteroides intestinalis]